MLIKAYFSAYIFLLRHSGISFDLIYLESLTVKSLKLWLGTALLSSLTAVTLVGTIAPVAQAHDESNEKFTFAIWGDMPYSDVDAAKLPRLINDINKARVSFSIFDGDLKSGSSRCDNAVYTTAIDRLNSFKAPAIYIPGDNEWTDCHRTNNGGYNNLERLEYVRKTLANSPKSFGQRTLPLERQGALGKVYAENVRWRKGDVFFVGLNVPGSNNNKVNSPAECTNKSARTQADCEADNAEYLARDAANIAFLRQTFAQAKAAKAKGLLVVVQADPAFDLPETETIDERAIAGAPGGPADGFTAFLKALAEETGKFEGQVAFVHGDVHFFKVDKPLFKQSDLLKNFTRLQTFGSPNVHWVKVTVDPNSRSIFQFEPMIVPGN